MNEHYNTLLVAWIFIAIIGGWLLINALIDLAARQIRDWLGRRGILFHSDEKTKDSSSDRKDRSRTIPLG
jgi:hypothetical protein